MNPKNPIKTLGIILMAGAMSALAVTLPAHAAPDLSMPSTGQMEPSRLAGTWTLIEAPQIHADGTRDNTFGADPKGVLMIDQSGQYSLQIYRANRPKFASADKSLATRDELLAAASMSTHTGHCFLDPAHGVIVFKIESASFPNWEGTEQRRIYELKGDELTYQVPASAGGGTTAISSWRKVR